MCRIVRRSISLRLAHLAHRTGVAQRLSLSKGYGPVELLNMTSKAIPTIGVEIDLGENHGVVGVEAVDVALLPANVVFSTAHKRASRVQRRPAASASRL